MRIIDISRELLSAPLFPGDPAPALEAVSVIGKGSEYNLSMLTMCVHNGTHLDAPAHFLQDGATAESIPLDKTIGEAEVVEAVGEIDAAKANSLLSDGVKRLFLKGRVMIRPDAAAVFSRSLDLLGTEELTVGRGDEIGEAHRTLLGAGVVILENLDLSAAEPGRYMLFAAPLKIKGADGAPVRAVLIQ